MGKAEKIKHELRYFATLPLPVVGWSVRVCGNDSAVTGIEFVADEQPAPDHANAVVTTAVEQLRAWIKRPDIALDFPMAAERGTAFQRRVWSALRRIAPGKTLTYGELARKLGSAPRAIGGACRANPLAIVVPCHRIVARNGLGGFSGAIAGGEVRVKQWLLKHEAEKKQPVR